MPLRRWLPPIALAALSLVFYWKLALTDQYVWFDHPDMSYIEIPRLQFQASEIHRGQFPLWDPRIWVGQPLIGQTQPGPLYPFNLLLYALPLTDGYIPFAHINWYFVWIHFQAALFCYWLARDLGRSAMASVIAGCLFSFGGFIGSVAWLDVVNGAVWTPLVFLYLLRALRGESPLANATLGGFSLGIAWLCGHHEIPMMVSYLALFTLLYHIYKHGLSQARLAAVFLGVAFLTSAVQTLPTYEFGKVSVRWVGLENAIAWQDAIPYAAHTVYSMPASGILGLALFGVNQADSSMFMGIAALGLAALGIIAGWSHSAVRWLTVVAAAALLYALGASTFFHGVFYSFAPLLGKARVPIRAIHLIHFAIAVLAAYGLDQLREQSCRWVRRITLLWLTFGTGMAALMLYFSVSNHPNISNNIMMSGWVALLLAALVFAHRAGKLAPQWMLGTVLLLILVELSALQNYAGKYDKDRNKFANSLKDNRDVAAFLKRQPWPSRAVVNDTDVPTNFGDLHGVDMLQGYVAGVSSNLMRHGLHTPQTQRLFAAGFLVARQAQRPDQELVFEGVSGVKVFRNPDTMPRAWAVHEALRVNGNDRLQALIHDPSFQPARTVLLLDRDAPALGQCPGSSPVEIVRHHSNRITLRVDMLCKGMVIVADTDFPGWRATVDGNPAPVVETYGALRGLVVDAGRHDIEMRYQPWSVYGGGALSFLGVICAVVAWRRR